MVFYYTCKAEDIVYTIYMGRDKVENEDLIKWGFEEDVWFHVDKLSSAHVYLRLHQDETLDDVPTSVIADCAQLVKANSIQGNKLNNISVVYTMWRNLKKTNDMEVGQVGFYNQKEVRKTHVEKRINEIVNRLNKTKVEKNPDLQQEKESREREEREKKKREDRELRKLEKEEEKRKQEIADMKSYKTLHVEENMTSNYNDGNESDDFM
ncbi:coiled-coil domain-containing protein 25-like [Tubulanus polymorphus]|uniref:coiled-coil domain-containing protein 25-like n=1 Tax=Tubulanus polymorphus TaxID=672921 RepID=UPI003DA1DA31